MSITSAINEKEVKNLLNTILGTIQTEADPYVLNQYRALIRKNVPFFQRSYFAAYLLMLQDRPQGRQRRSGGGDKNRGKPNVRNNAAINGAKPGGGAEPARQGERPAQQSPAPMALPEDESTQIFINIGRSRRIFPREILGLIGAKTPVSKEDIGIITILNNYSFVQVRNSVAAELMEALNGVSFRGKTLTVNYARTRKEDDEENKEPAPLPYAIDIDNAGSDAMDGDVRDETDGDEDVISNAADSDNTDAGSDNGGDPVGSEDSD
jgi:hypothetical protein